MAFRDNNPQNSAFTPPPHSPALLTTIQLLRTGDVPQLQPHHCLVIPLEHFEGEVHSDGGPVVLREDLVDVALYDGRFPDSQVADD